MECVFCQIASGESPATLHYQDDELIVITNKLQWVPIMLLAIPKRHMTQGDLWQDPLLSRMGEVLIDLGSKLAPGGFRLLSNFGRDAMQSQEHGHVHLIGGMHLGPYA